MNKISKRAACAQSGHIVSQGVHVKSRGTKLWASITSILALAASLLFGLYVHSQNVPEPNEDFIASVWVGQADRLAKLSVVDGSPQFELFASPIRSLAIDAERATVWSYGDGILRAINFDGSISFSITVGDINSTHTALAVDRQTGGVWLGVNNTLFAYAGDGSLTGTATLAKQVDDLGFDVTQRRLWVSDKDSVRALDVSLIEILSLDLGSKPKVSAMAVVPTDGSVWVALKGDIRHFDSSGRPLGTLVIDKIEHLTADAQGYVWAASTKDLLCIDSATGVILFSVQPFDGMGSIDAIGGDPADGSIWVSRDNLLRQIDASGLVVQEHLVGTAARALAVYADLVPPTLTIDAPEAGSFVNTNTPALELSYSDTGIGVDPATLEFGVDGEALSVTCNLIADVTASCTPDQPLAEGLIGLSATVADFDGNVSDLTAVQFTVDTIVPEIMVTDPEDGSVTNQSALMIIGSVNETATLSIDGQTASLDENSQFAFGPVTLAEGTNVFDLIATDPAGNQGPLTLTVTLDTQPPADPNITLIDVSGPDNGSVVVTGAPGSVEPGSVVTITNSRTGDSVTVIAGPDGSFTAQIAAQAGDVFTVQVEDAAGNLSNAIELITSTTPVLGTMGDQTVPIGSTLEFQLSATNPEVRTLTFGVTPLPLSANATLNAATGLFTFRPALDDVGVHTLTFSVTDGLISSTQAVDITVPTPDPTADTQFTSRLLDANDFAQGVTTPVVGATISFLNTGRTAISDADGFFVVTGLPDDDQVLDIDTSTADPAPNGSTYGGFREEIMLDANVNNIVERPFFLPRIDTNSITTVNPDGMTIVRNDALGVQIEIPPNTAKNPDGTDYTGELSISLVPEGLEPMVLPDEIKVGLLVTLQPVGVMFESPVPITFPNIDNQTPGNESDIWSLNPETGQFEVVGTAVVAADSQSIQTIDGGVRMTDWHALTPPPVERAGNPHADKQDPCNQDGQDLSSTVTSQTGCLSTSVSLPKYSSLGQSRGPTFVYKSERAYPQTLVPFIATVPRRASVPTTVSYSGSIGGVDSGVETFVDTSGFSESLDESLQGAVQFDGTELETRVYPYSIRITSNYGSTKRSSTISGQTIIVNDSDSPFGAGWALDGLMRLKLLPNQDAIITEGNGSVTKFAQSGGISGSALRFDGTNDHVSFGNTTGLFTHTWEAWAKVTDPAPAPGSSVSTIVGQLPGGGTCGRGTVLRVLSSGRVHYHVDPAGCGGTGSASAFSPLSIVGGWTHVAGTYDGTTARLYINGEFVDEDTGQLTPSPRLIIGAEQIRSVAQFLTGEIDEVRMWNVVRSGDEIRSTMTSTLTGTESGLVGYWKFDEADGQAILDSSPSGLNGVLGSKSAVQSNDPLRIDMGAPIDCVLGGVCLYVGVEGEFSSLERNEGGSFTRTLKDGTTINFDASGLQTSVVDRNGNTTTYLYDLQDRLTSITDPVGKVTSLAYSGDHLNSVTDPAGRITTFAHDANGNLIRVTFPDGTFKTFGYDDRHLMTSEKSERGFTRTREFNAAGRLKRATLPDGSERQATNFQSIGLVDPASGLGTESNPAPVVRPEEAVAAFTDGNGNIKIVETDSFGRATRMTDANNLTTIIDRDEDGNPIRTVRPDGSEISRTFDEMGNLLTVTEGFNGAVTTNAYDPEFNLITSATDPGDNTTTFERDANGNVTKTINALGHETTMVYDSQALVTQMTDPNGLVTTFTYNAAGLVGTQTETPPVGGGQVRVTTFSYDDAGQLTQSVSPDGITLTMDHDIRGRLIRTTDNLGHKVEFTYDGEGNRIQSDVIDADGTLATTVQQSFDTLNRLAAIQQPHIPGEDSITTFQYDGTGNQIGQTDPNGDPSLSVYDPENRLIQSIDALSGVTAFDYDDNGNLIVVTAPNGAITNFAYDPLSRRLTEQSPDRGLLTNSYDLANNLTSVTDARGITAMFDYDDLNRITSITYPDPTENVTFAYDTCAFGTGRLCSRTDASGSYVFSYDAFGNIIQQDYTNGGITFTTTYQYNAGNRVVSIMLPSGRTVAYTRDGMNRIQAIDAQVNGTMTNLMNSVSYRSDGALASRQYANGINEVRSYDQQGRLLQHSIGTLDQVLYSYDANGNVLSRNTQAANHSYQYDSLDRLTEDLTDGLGLDYTYDSNHNRLTEDDQVQTAQYTYEAASNRLNSIDTAVLDYDLAGNMIDDGNNRTFAYNDANRLFQLFDNGNLSATYTYNAQGLRKQKITATETIVYHYDLSGQLISETQQDGSPIRDYIWQDALPMAQIESDVASDTVTYLHSDHLATPRLGTNSLSTVVWRWEGGAFGQTPPDVDPDGDATVTTVNLRFPGQYADSESGLYYNWNRYYDPNTGRYITSDLVGLAGGPNTHLYAEANPLLYLDPFGLFYVSGEWTSSPSLSFPKVVRLGKIRNKDRYWSLFPPQIGIEGYWHLVYSRIVGTLECKKDTCGIDTFSVQLPLFDRVGFGWGITLLPRLNIAMSANRLASGYYEQWKPVRDGMEENALGWCYFMALFGPTLDALNNTLDLLVASTAR